MANRNLLNAELNRCALRGRTNSVSVEMHADLGMPRVFPYGPADSKRETGEPGTAKTPVSVCTVERIGRSASDLLGSLVRLQWRQPTPLQTPQQSIGGRRSTVGGSDRSESPRIAGRRLHDHHDYPSHDDHDASSLSGSKRPTFAGESDWSPDCGK